MEDILGPIGAIKTPRGELEVGNVGISNCVYLKYKPTDSGFAPTVVYNPMEFRDLLALAEQAVELAKSIRESTVHSVGVMPPKPATLRLALVRQTGQPAAALIRILLVREKVDLLTGPGELVALFKMAAVDGPPSLEGRLSVDGNSWSIDNKKLRLSGTVNGSGPHGEHLASHELRNGQQVRAWDDGKGELVCFQLLTNSTKKNVEEPLGQAADEQLARGHTHSARMAYQELIDKQLASGRVRAIWTAKIVLGTLISEIADGSDQKAQPIWLGQSPDPVLQKGIQIMESGDVGMKDFLCYQQVSAYFHSLNPNLSQAQSGVNGIMQSVCKGYAEIGDDNLLRLARSNWYSFLEEIFEGTPPTDATADLMRDCGGNLPCAQSITFPRPEPWCEPEVKAKQQRQDEPPSESQPKPAFNRLALVVLAACLILVGLFKLSGSSSGRSSSSVEPAELNVSMRGVKFGTSYEKLKSMPGWTEKPYHLDKKQFWGKLPGLSIHLDERKKMLRMTSAQLEYDDKVIIPEGTSQSTIQAALGVPAGKGGGGAHIYYVFEDGGARFVLEVMRGYQGVAGSLSLEPVKGRWAEARAHSLKELKL